MSDTYQSLSHSRWHCKYQLPGPRQHGGAPGRNALCCALSGYPGGVPSGAGSGWGSRYGAGSRRKPTMKRKWRTLLVTRV